MLGRLTNPLSTALTTFHLRVSLLILFSGSEGKRRECAPQTRSSNYGRNNVDKWLLIRNKRPSFCPQELINLIIIIRGGKLHAPKKYIYTTYEIIIVITSISARYWIRGPEARPKGFQPLDAAISDRPRPQFVPPTWLPLGNRCVYTNHIQSDFNPYFFRLNFRTFYQSDLLVF